MKTEKVNSVDLAEARLICQASSFSASRFMGRGQYELKDFPNLELGLAFLDLHPKGRWMLYAVISRGSDEGSKRSVLVTPKTLPLVMRLKAGEKL